MLVMKKGEVPVIKHRDVELKYRQFKPRAVPIGTTDTRQVFFKLRDQNPDFEIPEAEDINLLDYYYLCLQLQIIFERILNPRSSIFQSKISFSLDEDTVAVIEHSKRQPDRVLLTIQTSDTMETPFFVADYKASHLQGFSIEGDSIASLDFPDDFDEEQASYEELDEQMTLNSSVVSVANVRLIPRPQIELFENERVRDQMIQGKKVQASRYKKMPLRNNTEYQIGLDTYYFGLNQDQHTLRITVTRGETQKIKVIELPFVMPPDAVEQLTDVEDLSWAAWNLWNLLKYELQDTVDSE